jgi:hypothetical protein
MLYEVWGLLLERADQVLTVEVRDHVTDPAARAQLDAVATLLSELGAMWPRLFEGLAAETRLFAAGAGVDDACASDPLQAHRDAVHGLNERVHAARGLSGEERAQALRSIREAILAAAAVQGEIVEAGAARTAGRPGRRI